MEDRERKEEARKEGEGKGNGGEVGRTMEGNESRNPRGHPNQNIKCHNTAWPAASG